MRRAACCCARATDGPLTTLFGTARRAPSVAANSGDAVSSGAQIAHEEAAAVAAAARVSHCLASFPRVYWVAVPQALRARRANHVCDVPNHTR